MFLAWALFGALIGYLAAQKRGFSTVGGVVGGLLLGPLALLLFLISGIASKNEQRKKCPFCDEWVNPGAILCRHCQKDISPRAVYEARKRQSAG